MTRRPSIFSLFLLLSGTVLVPSAHPSFAQPVEKPRSVPEPVLQDTVHRDSTVAHGATEVGSSRSKRNRLTANDRWRALQNEVIAPTFLLASVGPATGDHVTGEPASWRGDVGGYGLRVASHAGRQLIESGTAHGLAAAARLDLRFQPRGRGGIGSRIRYAALEAVTARTPDGTRVPNLPRVVGTYGAVLAQQCWERSDRICPGVRCQSGEVRPGDAALTTALGLGIDVVVNVIVEFAGGS